MVAYMKRLALLLLLPSVAFAQGVPIADPPLQGITLTAQEYKVLLSNLASRDPAVALLLAKQNDAQQAAAKETPPVAQKGPKP